MLCSATPCVACADAPPPAQRPARAGLHPCFPAAPPPPPFPRQFYRGFRHDAHPMAIMCGVVGALSAFYPEVAEVK
jgi:hypothetical protein